MKKIEKLIFDKIEKETEEVGIGFSCAQKEKMTNNYLTEKAIKELDKCKKDPHYFATKYLKVKHNGKNYPFKTSMTKEEFNGFFNSYNINKF